MVIIFFNKLLSSEYSQNLFLSLSIFNFEKVIVIIIIFIKKTFKY